jgi:AbiV family abortive infection protein
MAEFSMGKELVSIEIYREAMEESLKNAEALIKASKTIASDASQAHAVMLHGLAQEEIAKGYACWLVIAEVIPRNHPLIGFSKKKSVFRNHDVKHELFILMGSTLVLAGLRGAKSGESYIPNKDEIFGMRLVADSMGPEITKIRSDMMYVDIRQNESKTYEVLSPLKLNIQDYELAYSFSESLIKQIRHLFHLSTTDDFKQNIERYRSLIRNRRPDYPENPLW